MTTPNQQKMLDWLEAGAPHVILDMTVCPGEHVFHDTKFLVRTNQVGKGDCGTVACIGGAAYLMSIAPEGELFGVYDGEPWSFQAGEALSFLGLEPDGHYPKFHQHSLFDPYFAPELCTPQQAADALRRAIAGKDPWR